MNQSMKLFQPISLGKTAFRNRIIMSSMLTHFASINGEVTDRLVAYHATRARGGVGLIFPEAFAVADSGLSYFPGVSIAHDRHVPGLRKLTTAVHAEGACIGAQLGHAGRFAQPEVSRMPRPLVSFVPGWCPVEDSCVLNGEEIERLAESFVSAAVRASEAGFDMVEVHGAHGYLIGEFLSPFFNRRTDEWGGNLENRTRFLRNVISGIRKALGSDFPVSVRLSSDEYIEGGLDLAQTVDIARAAVEAGANLIHVSAGIIETNRFTGPPLALPMGWNAKSAGTIRAALAGTGALVSVAGRIHTGEIAEDILQNGLADFISMGRALIADPELPNKIAAGKQSSVLPCLSCNEGCIGSVAKREPLTCAVNPRVGLELLPFRRNGGKKSVVVVGGGVAGMEVALTAARLGHDVTLYEKNSSLGGLLNVASLPPHKSLFLRLIDYYSYALVETNVRLVLGCAPTARELKNMTPDALVVGTGSMPLVPDFLKQSPAIPAAEVLKGTRTGQKVLVLGGGLVGAETAEFLAEQGKDVTILELGDAVAADMQGRARAFLVEKLKEKGTVFMTGTEILSIDADGTVTVKDRYGSVYPLPRFDTLVAALGYRADTSLSAELFAMGVPFLPVGDCIRAGKIMTAVHQAFQIACSL